MHRITCMHGHIYHTNSCLELHWLGNELTDTAATHTNLKDRWENGKIHNKLISSNLFPWTPAGEVTTDSSQLKFSHNKQLSFPNLLNWYYSKCKIGKNEVSAETVVWAISQLESVPSFLTFVNVRIYSKPNTCCYGTVPWWLQLHNIFFSFFFLVLFWNW